MVGRKGEKANQKQEARSARAGVGAVYTIDSVAMRKGFGKGDGRRPCLEEWRGGTADRKGAIVWGLANKLLSGLCMGTGLFLGGKRRAHTTET